MKSYINCIFVDDTSMNKVSLQCTLRKKDNNLVVKTFDEFNFKILTDLTPADKQFIRTTILAMSKIVENEFHVFKVNNRVMIWYISSNTNITRKKCNDALAQACKSLQTCIDEYQYVHSFITSCQSRESIKADMRTDMRAKIVKELRRAKEGDIIKAFGVKLKKVISEEKNDDCPTCGKCFFNKQPWIFNDKCEYGKDERMICEGRNETYYAFVLVK